MASSRAESSARPATVLCQIAGYALGIMLVLALFALIKTSLDFDREALFSQTTSRWSQPFAIAAFVALAAVAIVSRRGKWPLGGQMLDTLRGMVAVAMIWMIASAANALGVHVGILCGAVALAYIVTGALASWEWMFLTAPLTSAGIALVAYHWGLLATDTTIYVGVEKDLGGLFATVVSIIVGPTMMVIAAALLGIGRWIGVILDDRLT